jgi:hypothetical protein
MFILYCYNTNTVKCLLGFLVGNFPMVQTHLIHLHVRDRVGFTLYKLSIWKHCSINQHFECDGSVVSSLPYYFGGHKFKSQPQNCLFQVKCLTVVLGLSSTSSQAMTAALNILCNPSINHPITQQYTDELFTASLDKPIINQ